MCCDSQRLRWRILFQIAGCLLKLANIPPGSTTKCEFWQCNQGGEKSEIGRYHQTASKIHLFSWAGNIWFFTLIQSKFGWNFKDCNNIGTLTTRPWHCFAGGSVLVWDSIYVFSLVKQLAGKHKIFLVLWEESFFLQFVCCLLWAIEILWGIANLSVKLGWNFSVWCENWDWCPASGSQALKH